MSSSGSGRPPLHPNSREQQNDRSIMPPPPSRTPRSSQTTPPTSSPTPASDSAPVAPPEVSEEQQTTTKKRARAWQHFHEYKKNGKVRAQCNYCDKNYACESGKNGTSGMNNHMKVCKKHPDNIVKSTMDSHTIHSFCRSVTGVDGEGDCREVSSLWKFDQEAIRKAVNVFLIVDEHPFRTVEKEGFRYMMSIACPQFIIPSRTTVARDCFKMYLDEKNKLKDYFRTNVHRLSLTTDTWTASNQKLNYMCLTAHFIDDNWKLHKRILNFIPCPSHKGEEIGFLIERCLSDWGISHIFTITVDNASSNDTSVTFLRDRFVRKGTSLLRGKYLHMRCVAHIINLVVRDGLKDVSESVDRVRNLVRYVRQSTARLLKFEVYQVEERVESKKSLCLDVPTRWNSVYLMLETALIFQRVFERYEMCDAELRADFRATGTYGRIGLPNRDDWLVVEKMVKILQHFYDLTLRISGSLYVTSNTFLDEISDVDDLIKDWICSDDIELQVMAQRMKAKLDKYWGDNDKMNMLLYVAVMLDPRNKFSYVNHVMKNMYGNEEGSRIASMAKDALIELFNEYKVDMPDVPVSSNANEGGSSSSTFTSVSETNVAERERNNKRAARKQYQKMLCEIGMNDQSELERYLSEHIVKDSPQFDLMEWWKVHVPIYPVLSALARHVFAMPISTVASESAFSTGGRVIDDYRASLAPKTAQALICGQDWIRQAPIGFLEEASEAELISNIYNDVVSRSLVSEESVNM